MSAIGSGMASLGYRVEALKLEDEAPQIQARLISTGVLELLVTLWVAHLELKEGKGRQNPCVGG